MIVIIIILRIIQCDSSFAYGITDELEMNIEGSLFYFMAGIFWEEIRSNGINTFWCGDKMELDTPPGWLHPR